MTYARQGESSKKSTGGPGRGSARPARVSTLAPQHASNRMRLAQQTLGNQGVLRRMEAGLRINDVNDPAEKEADSVAAAVMAGSGGEAHPPAVAGSRAPFVQRKCAACEEEEELHVQRKETSAAQPTSVPPIVGQVLNTPGRPLDHNTRDFMRSRFGRDFGTVRVHNDAQAAESARAVNAMAFTVGDSLVFGAGNYSPETERGKWILAHELAHVIQQRRGGPAASVDSGGRLELAANEASAGVMRGEGPVPVSGASAPGIARLPTDADVPISLSQDLDVSTLSADQRQQLIQRIDNRLRYLESRAGDIAQPKSGIQIPGLAVDSPEAERARLFDWRRKLGAGTGTLAAFGIVRSNPFPVQGNQTSPASTPPNTDTKVPVLRGTHKTPVSTSHLDIPSLSSDQANAAIRAYFGGEQAKDDTSARNVPQAHTSPPAYLAPKNTPHTLEDTIAATNADPHSHRAAEDFKHLEVPPLSTKEQQEAKKTFHRKPGEVTLPNGKDVTIPPKPPSEITEDIKSGEITIASANVQGVRADVVRNLNSELSSIEQGPVNREVIDTLRKAHDAIRLGDLESAVELTKSAKSAQALLRVSAIARMSNGDRLLEAVKRAVWKIPNEARKGFEELLTPESIASMAVFTSIYVISQYTPFGWAADVVAAGLLVTTLYMAGGEVVTIVQNLADFASIASNAKTESELDQAAGHLATAVTKLGVDVVIAILLHKAGKAAGPYLKPPPTSGAVADVVTPRGKPVRVPLDSVPESGSAIKGSAPDVKADPHPKTAASDLETLPPAEDIADVLEPTRFPETGNVKSRHPRGFETGRATPGRNVKPGTLEDLEPTGRRRVPGPRTKAVTRDQQLEGIDPSARTRVSFAAEMNDALQKASDPAHPLHELTEPGGPGSATPRQFRKVTRTTESGKTETGRFHGGETGPVVQAGHQEAFASGAPQRFVLEDADMNQTSGNVIESKGAFSSKESLLVTKPDGTGGVWVEAESLKQWERLGVVPAGTVDAAIARTATVSGTP